VWGLDYHLRGIIINNHLITSFPPTKNLFKLSFIMVFMGKTIGIISLKGGVGKTSSVVALGDAISGFGKNVLLVDGNLSAPNLGLHLNIIDPEVTLHHVLNRSANMKDAIHKLDSFDVLPASISTNINVSPLKLKDKLGYFKRKYDMILIDSSPSLGEETLGSMLASDEVFVVTTPDYPTLSTTLKAIKLAKQRGIQVDGLILNKVHNKNFELSLKDIEKTSELPVMAVIPYDLNVLRALSEFEPLTALNPRSEASREYKRLAAALIGEKYEPVKIRKLFRWINPRQQDINREVFYDRVFRD
jgi:septum site-determining protein MinD